MNNTQPHSTRLFGRRLIAARIVWAVLVLGSLSMFSWGVVERLQHPVNEGCRVVECNPIDLTDEDLEQIGASESGLATILAIANLVWNLSFLAAAALIVSRRSDDWMALWVSFTLVALGAVAFSPANSVLLVEQSRLAPLVNSLEALGYVSLFFLLLLFPDGRFVPSWTRWTIVLLALIFLPIDLLEVGLASVAAILLIAVYSQMYRYRNVSGPLQRQQTKWVAVGLASQLIVMGSWIFIATQHPANLPTPARTTTLLFVLPIVVPVGSMFPVSVTVAILRYRMWDIDLVINRTLVYGLLTGVLVLVYFLSVVTFQSLLRTLTGQESPLAVVASTLLIAALFNPLRQRIQAVIDRRLYRRKYDAARMLEAFGETLREEVDLGELSDSLLQVVDQAVQPEHTSLWLRERE